MDELGPVDYLIVAFPGNEFRGEIGPALADLVEAGTIRIIDLAFVGKSAEGEIVAFELTDLDPEVQAVSTKLGVEVNGLFNEDDLDVGGRGARAGLVGRAPRVGERVGSRRGAEDARCRRRPARLRPAAARGRSGRARSSAGERLEGRTQMMMRRRGPGLVGAAARTAVVAGTATAVSGRVARRQQSKYAAQGEQQAVEAAPAPVEAEQPAYMAELTQLAELRDQGVLSPEEFDAKKKQLLGL